MGGRCHKVVQCPKNDTLFRVLQRLNARSETMQQGRSQNTQVTIGLAFGAMIFTLATRGCCKVEKLGTLWSWERRRRVASMFALITTLSTRLVCRFRGRAALELEVVALRH